MTVAPDPFDSTHLARRVYRLAPPPVEVPADAGMVVARVEPGREGPLLAAGFRLVERLLRFAGPCRPGPLPPGIRPARPADHPAIAGIPVTESRFHADPLIARRHADAAMAAWLAANLAGRADQVLVAEDDGIAGHVMLRAGTIDLIAVAPGRRRQGWGRLLVAAALAAGEGDLAVGAQSGNAAAVALYRAAGLVPAGSLLTLHWHRSADQPE